MELPVFFWHELSDVEMLGFLQRRLLVAAGADVSSDPAASRDRFIPTVDVYGAEPWKVQETLFAEAARTRTPAVQKECSIFFTPRRRGLGNRVSRTAGRGFWRDNGKKEIKNSSSALMGTKESLKYDFCWNEDVDHGSGDAGNENKGKRKAKTALKKNAIPTEFIMTEYCIDSSSSVFQEIAICIMKISNRRDAGATRAECEAALKRTKVVPDSDSPCSASTASPSTSRACSHQQQQGGLSLSPSGEVRTRVTITSEGTSSTHLLDPPFPSSDPVISLVTEILHQCQFTTGGAGSGHATDAGLSIGSQILIGDPTSPLLDNHMPLVTAVPISILLSDPPSLSSPGREQPMASTPHCGTANEVAPAPLAPRPLISTASPCTSYQTFMLESTAAFELPATCVADGSTTTGAGHVDNEDLDIPADLVLLISDETSDTLLTFEDWMESDETSKSIVDTPPDFDAVSTYLLREQDTTSTCSVGAANHSDLAEGLLYASDVSPLSKPTIPITCLAEDQCKATTSSCAKDNEAELGRFATQTPEINATILLSEPRSSSTTGREQGMAFTSSCGTATGVALAPFAPQPLINTASPRTGCQTIMLDSTAAFEFPTSCAADESTTTAGHIDKEDSDIIADDNHAPCSASATSLSTSTACSHGQHQSVLSLVLSVEARTEDKITLEGTSSTHLLEDLAVTTVPRSDCEEGFSDEFFKWFLENFEDPGILNSNPPSPSDPEISLVTETAATIHLSDPPSSLSTGKEQCMASTLSCGTATGVAPASFATQPLIGITSPCTGSQTFMLDSTAAFELPATCAADESTSTATGHVDNEDLDIPADLVLISDETLDTLLTFEDWMESDEISKSIADTPPDFDAVSTYLLGEQGTTSTCSGGAADLSDLADRLLYDASGDHHFPSSLSKITTPITCLVTGQSNATASPSSSCAKDNDAELQTSEISATYEIPCSSSTEDFFLGFDAEVFVTTEIPTSVPSEPPSPSSDPEICVPTEDPNTEPPNPSWSAGEQGLTSICFEPMTLDGLLDSAPAVAAVDTSTSTCCLWNDNGILERIDDAR